MKIKTSNPKDFSSTKLGFPLIATMSLMLLLAVIVIGILSLSLVEVRKSGQQQSMAEAQANARMALLMALGELQKQAGDDRRATANASVLSEIPGDVPQAHIMGAWSSTGEGRENGDELNANNVGCIIHRWPPVALPWLAHPRRAGEKF